MLIAGREIRAGARLTAWPLMDVWDIDLAAKLIAVGGPIEVQDAVANGEAVMAGAYGTCLSLARASVAARKIFDPDTPTRWIDWAKEKGYSVDHLVRELARNPRPPTAARKPEGQGPAGWQDRARQLVHEAREKRKRRGQGVTDRELADDIEKTLRAEGYVTQNGTPPAAGTIRKQVLVKSRG